MTNHPNIMGYVFGGRKCPVCERTIGVLGNCKKNCEMVEFRRLAPKTVLKKLRKNLDFMHSNISDFKKKK